MNDTWKVELTSPDGQKIYIELDNCSIDAIRPVTCDEEKRELETHPFIFYSITGISYRTVST